MIEHVKDVRPLSLNGFCYAVFYHPVQDVIIVKKCLYMGVIELYSEYYEKPEYKHPACRPVYFSHGLKQVVSPANYENFLGYHMSGEDGEAYVQRYEVEQIRQEYDVLIKEMISEYRKELERNKKINQKLGVSPNS